MAKGAGTRGGTRRAKPKAPVGCYWRGDVLWARFKVANVEYRRSCYTGSPGVAEEERKRLRREIVAQVRHGKAPAVSWDEAVLKWSESPPDNLSAGTIKRYATSLLQVESHLTGRALTTIDADLLREMVKDRRRSASKRTVQRDLTAISSVLDVAEEEGWVKDNVAHAFNRKKLREARHRIVLPVPAYVEEVIAAGGKLGELAEFAWDTGARMNEIVHLARIDADTKARRAVLHAGTKRDKVRAIPLRQRALKVAKRQPAKLGCDLLFWGPSGTLKNVSSNFARLVKRVARKAAQEGREFRPFTFHHLRHLFAVEYLRDRRGSIYDLRDELGHDSVKTTEIYLDFLTPEEAAWARQGGGTKGGTGAAVRAQTKRTKAK